MAIQRYFGFLNATKSYLKFLATQGVSWPAYGVRLQWDNFIRILSPRPTNASMIQPRNLSAYYANDPTALLLDGSNNVILWEDWSGNSATPTLCLNGVVGNYASTPNAAPIQILGNIDVRIYAAAIDWTPTATQALIAKYDVSGNQRAYQLFLNTDGTLTLYTSPDGTGGVLANTSIATGLTDNTAKWIRATRLLNDGAGNRVTTFYLSDDGQNWTVLGTPFVQSGVGNPTFNSTAPLTLGCSLNAGVSAALFTGRIYRAQIYNGIAESGGILAFDADFSKAAKLATSFTESSPNAATVTINSTGDTGARVAGERDLYQGTSTKRPAYTQANGRQRLFLTFDGTDDYLKAPSFTLVQPETVYFVGSQVTWTLGRVIYDGLINSRMQLIQNAVIPDVRIYAGGGGSMLSPLWSLGVRVIQTSIFDSTLSMTRINRGAITATGTSIGAASASGFTLGTDGNQNLSSNITSSEIAIYSESHNAVTQGQIIGYLSNKYSIGL